MFFFFFVKSSLSVSLHLRLNLPRTFKHPKHFYTPTITPALADPPGTAGSHITQGDRHIIWQARTHKEPPPRPSHPLLHQSDNVLREPAALQRGSRGRRHVHGGGTRGHGHLMRVGCVLGTCQVQNLSHRLYQLIGQSGREDSSPINPRSPHSFG